MNRSGRAGPVFAGIAAAAVMLGSATFAVAETLTDALVGAYETSGLLEQNRALLRAADEDVAVAVSALRPIVSWQADVSRSFGVQRNALTGFSDEGFQQTDAALRIFADLTLYDFGANRFAIEAAKETVLSTREALRATEQQVLLRAVQAFMNLRRERENVLLRQNNLKLLNEELRATRDRFEVGEVTRTDVALAEARVAAAQSALAAAEGIRDQALAEYVAVVGHRPRGALRAPANLPRLASSENAAAAVALRAHPEILRLQHDIRAADLGVLRAEAAMKPRLSVNGTLSLSGSEPDSARARSATVGIRAEGPIYQGGRLSALLRRAKAQRDAARSALHEAERGVRRGVSAAWANLGIARAGLAASEKQIRAARVAFDGVREEAKLGARTTLDVLDAEQELLDAEASRISASADLYIAAYSVLASMGKLTAEDLRLPVRRYDPAEYYNMVKGAPARASKQGRQLDRVLKALGKE